MNCRGGMRKALPVLIVGLCLFGRAFCSRYTLLHDFLAALLSADRMLIVCLSIWYGSFIFLTFCWKDFPLIGLVLIAIVTFFISYSASQPAIDCFMFLAGMTLGKGATFALKADGRWKIAGGESNSEIATRYSSLLTFLIVVVVLLAFSSCWHLEVARNFYPGTRWTGLWDNPNIYGMLMGAGGILATGLFAANLKFEILIFKLGWVFGIVMGMMLIGLVMSYSRGALLATAVGLLYLAWCYGKSTWLFITPGVLGMVAVIALFWHSTADSAPWYLKRLDLGRPSAQHRVSAWRAGFQMMWDHPFGVGWNKAVEVYQRDYSPPENGAAAITTNDYLMLGTQLGWPGLICFVTYVGLCFKKGPGRGATDTGTPGETTGEPAGGTPALRCACRAGVLSMMVAFWFDGGLFTLATGSVFWILLELGSVQNRVRTVN